MDRALTTTLVALAAATFAACGGPGSTASADADPGITPDVPADVLADVPSDADDVPGRDIPAEVLADVPTDVPGDVPADLPSDTPPEAQACNVDLQCGTCSTCVGGTCQSGYPLTTLTESEAAGATGTNDTFLTADPIPFGVVITSHIGVADDIDWYRICVEQEGVITVRVEFAEAYKAQTLDSIDLHAYSDPWEATEMGLATSDSSNPGSCTVYDTIEGCKDSVQMKIAVTPVQGTYGIKVSPAVYGDRPGFDAVNPYKLTVTFAPGALLEADQPDVDGVHVGLADVWKTAFDLNIPPTGGSADIGTYGWYWYDVDWFKTRPAQTGWMRLCVDSRGMDDNDPSTTLFSMLGIAYRMTADGLVDVTADDALAVITGDTPNCPTDCDEIAGLPGDQDYYIHVHSAPGVKDGGYRLKVAFGPGGPEDDQPGLVGAAATSADAYDMGTLGDTPGVATSYLWHWADDDWYKMHTPVGADGTLDVVVDYQATYDAHGWYDCALKPDGVEVYTYLFDKIPEEYPAPAVSYDDDVPRQHITLETAKADHDYWLYVRSAKSFDKDHPYTVSATFVQAL